MVAKRFKKICFLLVTVLALALIAINIGLPRVLADATVNKYINNNCGDGDLILTGETWQDAPLNYRKSFDYQYVTENGEKTVKIKAYPGYFPVFVLVDSYSDTSR